MADPVPDQARHLRIGEVAERVGVTTRTIRYYEELGLLGGTGTRNKGAHRLYDESDVARLRELVRLRDLLGLSLEQLIEVAEESDVAVYLRAQWANSTDDASRAQVLRAGLTHVQRQLELIRSRQRGLADFEAQLLAKQARIQESLAEHDRRPVT
jgi:MerR family transcriptional regulator, repressor of the yfmOP operon